MEGDIIKMCKSGRNGHFNPLPPYGGRQHLHTHPASGGHFNPLPPYGGRLKDDRQLSTVLLFQSTPSVWRETVPFAVLIASF